VNPRAYVLGRLSADLYPQQLNTPLEEVRTFERFVGGFAGNIATGLARLGVPTAIVSAVGDDGHGRFARAFLDREGVDTSALRVHPTLRTALAFCEAWPPDHFPLTFYRTPTCPDWELRPEDLPREMDRAWLVYASGTGLAREPSRTTTLTALERRASGTTIFDLDWRETLWTEPADYGRLVRHAAGHANVLLGGASEFAAAGLEPRDALALGPDLVVVKRGGEGAAVLDRDGERQVTRVEVPVVNGLGAGDAFAAAFGAALIDGLDAAESAKRANAAGAIVAARLSCSTAMPTAAEIDLLLAGGQIVEGEVLRR